MGISNRTSDVNDDPLVHVLHLAEQSDPKLPGWKKIDDVSTDHVELLGQSLDVLTIDVSSEVQYQDVNDTVMMVEIARAIQSRIRTPFSLDLRANVKHSRVQADGSISLEYTKETWIEIIGDPEELSFKINVYGFLPAQQSKLTSIKDALSSRYPKSNVKISDASSLDD